MVREVCGGSLVEAKIASPKSILALRASLPFMPVESFCAEIAPRQETKSRGVIPPNESPRGKRCPDSPRVSAIQPKSPLTDSPSPKWRFEVQASPQGATNIIALQEPKTHAGQGLRVKKL